MTGDQTSLEGLLLFYAMHEEPYIEGSLFAPGGFDNPQNVRNALEMARVSRNRVNIQRMAADKAAAEAKEAH